MTGVGDVGWDRAAVQRLRAGDVGVLGARPLAAVLQHAGQALLGAAGASNEDLVRRCLAALRERGEVGDDVLAVELQAALGEPITNERVRWPLTTVPVDLEVLADFLDGDPLRGDGVIDLVTGDVYPPGVLDWDRPDELDENSDSFDPDRWLHFQPESGDGYRDMRDFTVGLPEGRLRDQLLQALDGRGAFRRFRSVFNDDAYRDQLGSWMLFRDERQLGRARDWLARAGYRSVH